MSMPITSPSARFTAAAVENSLSDWMRALDVLQKRWRLSAVFALAVFLTVVCVTYLTTPDL